MAKYLLILGGADLDKRGGNPEFRPMMLERYMAWVRDLRERGQFVSSHKLYDQTGRRLTIRGGEVTDGPFIEAKDAVGGIFVIEAASLDEATDVARACPVLDLQNGYVEVRVIEASQPNGRG
ncbi:MAG TPA: YciI family protein [Gemmatimonadaceae bacterium]|nr:YciI family protein [Gemmatimonadaceae bacterium]